MARMAIATVFLTFILVPTEGANKDWGEAVVQAVQRQENGIQDYTVVDDSTEYVLRPYSGNFAVQLLDGFNRRKYSFTNIPVVAGDHVEIVNDGQGMKLRDQRGKQYACLIVSSRVLPKQPEPLKRDLQPEAKAMTNDDVLKMKFFRKASSPVEPMIG
jgi:hypothetical protein